MRYDFFVSHASEDKPAVVRPLVTALKAKGYRVASAPRNLTCALATLP